MSGIELLKWVRKQPALHRLTVALVSSSDSPSDMERGYEFGTDRYLVKYPVEDVLRQVVEEAMARFFRRIAVGITTSGVNRARDVVPDRRLTLQNFRDDLPVH